ncbi:hypothetical protein GQ53DRAFT_761778 [Thozetella sp. PMI_491]|nr:hypothetical protein GQ53DRAFT_761778 [Thozetella sp. PMI_491]
MTEIEAALTFESDRANSISLLEPLKTLEDRPRSLSKFVVGRIGITQAKDQARLNPLLEYDAGGSPRPSYTVLNVYRWFCALILANHVSPIAMQNLGWKYYILFCRVLFCLLWIIYLLFPEIKGRTLEEIREVLEKDAAPLLDLKHTHNLEAGQTQQQNPKAMPKTQHIEA